MYGRDAYGQVPYAGTQVPAPPVGQLPPPIPGNPATFSYSASLAAYPWAVGSYGGGFPLATYPGGGVLVTPLPDSGVMSVTAWWPNAAALQVTRIDIEGNRSPVRGAYPITVTQVTRTNWATNPSIETGTNGYVPDVGTPTLTRIADSAAPLGGWVLRATNASSGSNGVTVPTSLLSPPTGQTMTIAWSMRTSARPTSVTLTVGWANSAGSALTTTSVALTTDQINNSIAQFARQMGTFTPPVGAVTPTVKITAGGMPAGGTMDLDAITIENGLTDGSAFDGSTFAASWTGTTDLSASVLAPTYTILDGECPLDTLVTYQVTYPGITGGWVLSTPATLLSSMRSWLTHPSNPDEPIQINLRRKPKRDYPIAQGVFAPIGRRNKVVVSASVRQGAEGTIEFNALSANDRETLLGMFADGQPVLVRAPADYHFEDQWLSLATVSDDPEDRLAYVDAWLISAPFIEVEAPSVLA